MAKYTFIGPFVANTTPYYNTTTFLNGVEDALKVAQEQVADVNTQTVTTYTLALTDAGKVVEMNNASANTVTVPQNSSVAFPINTVIEIHQYGAGATTVSAGTGSTLRPTSTVTVTAQYKSLRIRKRATNEWIVE
jgi:hypothetical protein